jgi:hypothetical protein
MSSNRLIYDECVQKEQNNRNSNQLNWILDNQRFETPQQQCMEDNLVSGNTIGNNNIPNRVDIETALFGIDNKSNSECKVPRNLKHIDTIAKQNNCNIVGQRNNNAKVHPLTDSRCDASIDYLNSVSDSQFQELNNSNPTQDNSTNNELQIIQDYN